MSHSECDREPIHVPGGIQPHGVLLVIEESTLTVTQVTENLVRHCGVAAAQMVGEPLGKLLDEAALRTVSDALAHESLEEMNPLRLEVAGHRFDGILHRHDGATVLELEPLPPDVPAYSSHHALRPVLLRLKSAESLAALYEQTLAGVRELTGFERVMIYRFDERGHGSVDAELKDPGLEAYLGVHYPASDIPQQARLLYMKNWLRIIPDAGYVPSPLLPELRPDTGKPLDLSFAVLRSVSPVHREYLANMGVTASMSVSLVVRGRLWGLISCTHHSGPRQVRFELRSACEVLARLASLEIAAIEDRETAAARAARRDAESALHARMRNSAPSRDLLLSLLDDPMRLLDLVKARAVAVSSRGACETYGSAPPREFIQRLARWLDQHHGNAVFATESLPSQWPPAGAFKEVASGLLTFALPGELPRRLLWFRGEELVSVTWGGDPNKAVETGADARPHPRRSFALWREEVRLQSRRWTASDMEAAEELRRDAVEVDLEQQLTREHLAVRARDEVLGVVSHDLRNPLYAIGIQAHELILRSAGNLPTPEELRDGAKLMESAVERMNLLIDNLVDLAAMEAGRLQLFVQSVELQPTVERALETLRPLAESRQVSLITYIDAGVRMQADANRFYQVLSNLIGNAAKFTPAGGSITLRTAVGGDRVTFTIEDTGPGIAPEQIPNLFTRYGPTAQAGGRRGAGLGLFVVKGIVEAHGGAIVAHNSPEGGATFRFWLPRA